jgi:hypothetical protein
MKLQENQERFYNVKDLEAALRLIAGFDEAMAVVNCDPQTYRLFDDDGRLIYERKGYHIP